MRLALLSLGALGGIGALVLIVHIVLTRRAWKRLFKIHPMYARDWEGHR